MADKQGFLTKEGGSWKNWKKRYFVLKSGSLFYSKSQATGHLGTKHYAFLYRYFLIEIFLILCFVSSVSNSFLSSRSYRITIGWNSQCCRIQEEEILLLY